MRYGRILRQWALTVSVVVFLLAAGCDGTTFLGPNMTFLDFLSTVFLGVTAAGSVAILRNV